MDKNLRKSSPDGGRQPAKWILRTDNDGNILSASPGILSFLGKKDTDIQGLPVNRIAHIQDQQEFGRLLNSRLRHSGDPVHLEFICKNDKKELAFSIFHLPGGPSSAQGFIWQAIWPSANCSNGQPDHQSMPGLLDQLFGHNPVAVLACRVTDWRIMYSNKAWNSQPGYPAIALCECSLFDLVDLSERRSLAEKVFSEENPVFNKEVYHLYNEAGTSLPMQWSGNIADFENGSYLLLYIHPLAPTNLHVPSDKDSPKSQAELEKIRKKEEELRMLLSSLDDIVVEFDMDYRYLGIWCRDESLLLVNPNHIIGKTVHEVLKDYPSYLFNCLEDLDFVKNSGILTIREYALEYGGHTKWFNAKVAPIYAPDGSMKGFSKRVTDITEKKIVELAIEEKNDQVRKAHRELSEIIVNATEIIFKLDQQGRVIFVSPECERGFGYTEAEVIGKHFLDFIHPNDQQASKQRFNDFLQGPGPARDVVTRIRRKDHSYAWVSSSYTFITDENGNKSYVLGFAQDITGLKQASDSLHEAEERYRMFIHQSSEGIWRFETLVPPDINLSPEEMITYFGEQGFLAECNDAYAKMLGCEKAEEITGMPLSQMLSPDDPDNIEFFLSFIRSGYNLKDAETIEVDRNGNKKHFLNNLVGIIENNKLMRVWGTQRDITNEKQVQIALRESEERFRQLADTAPVMIWVSDEHDRTTYVNKSWIDFTGIPSDVCDNEMWVNLVHPEDVEIAIARYRENFVQKLPITMEYRLKSVSGQYKWVIDQGVPRFLQDGKFVGYVGTVMDINDRRKAEEKIRYQAQVMQNVSESVVSTDLEKRIVTWNKAAEKIFGYSKEEVIGQVFQNVIRFHYINSNLDEAIAYIESHERWEGEVYFIRKDGKKIYLHNSVSLVKNERNEKIGMVGIHRDISDKRKSEEALRKSEERYRSLVEALGEGILLHNDRGEIIACNRSAETILGIPAEDLLGKSSIGCCGTCIREDGQLFPADSHPAQLTLQTGKAFDQIIMGIYHRDGRLTWISTNTEPIYYSEIRDKPDAVVASIVDITENKIAEMELQRSEKQLREYSGRIMGILDSITDGFIALDKDLRVVLWNHVLEKVSGISVHEAMGRKITELFPQLPQHDSYNKYIQAMERKETLALEHYYPSRDTWFETSAYSSDQGIFLYFRDITERKKQEAFLQLEKKVLELNASQTSSLKATVDYFLEGIEGILPALVCSVLTLDEDEETIRHLSAPTMPVEYVNSINGIKIGPSVGSCGTAMFRKKEVLVEDIGSSPLWTEHRHLAAQCGFCACWSFPILNANNKVLATVAAYLKQRQLPGTSEKSLFLRICNILRVIIENKKSEAIVRQTNERYLLATMATNDAIWDWDMETDNLYWGEGFYSLFGYRAGNYSGKMSFWEEQIHPQDRERVVNGLRQFCSGRQAQLWEDEYRFLRSDGKYVLVYDRGFLIFNQHGKVSRMVGSLQDITEKREMEKRLLKQELDRQKLVAQAVVEAQEKERAMIGKELHDNVNQILSTAKLYLELAGSDDKDVKNLMALSSSNIADAINEIRAISRSLVPSSIDDLGLIDSIGDLAEGVRATRKLHVEFHHRGEIDRVVDEQQKLMLFRITQEQVNNILKHANAKNLVVELVLEDDVINLTIQDDGKGFDYSKVKGKKGIGLSNIASRAELFNGKINMVTAPGKGCTLHVTVPIKNI